MNLPIPKDPRHQRFADRILAGDSLVDAYIAATAADGKKLTRDSAMTGGKRWIKLAAVTTYIAGVQQEAAKGAVASVQYKRELLFQIMDVPITAIDPEDPKRTHHKLIKKLKRRFEVDKETEREICIEEIEKHDPLKAIELDNKLSGDDADANGLTQIAEAIAALASTSTLPTGTM